ncbi:MAG: winged helix-turn-helix transcriptional regulator [Devosia sp.]
MLVKVASRAWSLSILAALVSGTPARQAPLLAATGAGRTAFTASLNHLVQLDILERNPGHGHPLRPEYRLTAKGEAAAVVAARVMGTVNGRSEAALIRRTWTLPVLAVTERPKHFNEIKHSLSGVSDRALSKSLRQLEERTWLHRHVDIAQRPPRPTYEAVDLGAHLSRAVGLTAPHTAQNHFRPGSTGN